MTALTEKPASPAALPPAACPSDPLGLRDEDAWALTNLPQGGWLAVAEDTRVFADLDEAIRHLLR